MRTFAAILAIAPALLSFASAQTWTDCNPMEKTCAPNPALAGTYEHDFAKGAAKDFAVTYNSLVYNRDNVAFRVGKKRDAPTIASRFYIMFGRLEVTLRAAPGAGVVSSVVLQSDNLDEIDWEWVGSKPDESQSNYFGKGVTAGYDRGAYHPGPTQDKYHTFAFDWTPEKLDWIIDGQVVRTLRFEDNPGFYPQTPCNVRIGAWAAGDPDNEKGTIEWAGGEIDYSKGPYDMLVKSIYVQDYSSGKEYVYGDKSGSWQSIKSVGGTVNAGPQLNNGNIGKIEDTPAGSNSGTIADSSQFKAPSNSGLVPSATEKTRPSYLHLLWIIWLGIWLWIE
ncbi:hypothetical protein EX30DRAFT_224118 [Ascodesmis nigricans]|uniref:chitinase n=1 Tax=Ascodesmis nigricans TaxID=341454 RepID=A0A4S2MJ24_9PEZI|nr:hypothetical protein EX30DRAFT_224118 [Ascodesmis nigricans]